MIIDLTTANNFGLGFEKQVALRPTGYDLSLVGERNLVAGNASGEEFFLASLVGEDLAGKI